MTDNVVLEYGGVRIDLGPMHPTKRARILREAQRWVETGAPSLLTVHADGSTCRCSLSCGRRECGTTARGAAPLACGHEVGQCADREGATQRRAGVGDLAGRAARADDGAPRIRGAGCNPRRRREGPPHHKQPIARGQPAAEDEAQLHVPHARAGRGTRFGSRRSRSARARPRVLRAPLGRGDGTPRPGSRGAAPADQRAG